MKKKSYSTGGKVTPFGRAFSGARKAGKETFTFGGKSYHTRTKEEEDARIASGRPSSYTPIEKMPSGKMATSVTSSSVNNKAATEIKSAPAAKKATTEPKSATSMDRKSYREQAKSSVPTRKEARFERFKDRVDARMERKRKRRL
jgi:hypothetical protein